MAAALTRRHAIALGVDAVCVLVFATLGQRSHDDSAGGLSGVLSTAAPFLCALVVVSLAVATIRRDDRTLDPLSPERGVTIGLFVAIVGLAARRLLWDRGIAVAFIVVATLFLCATFGGWRAVVALQRRRAAS